MANELYYLRARYYDPKLGRFWTQDPLPAGNLYTYGRNNSANRVDPSGLCTHGGGWLSPGSYLRLGAAETT